MSNLVYYKAGIPSVYDIATRVVSENYQTGTSPEKPKVLDFYDPESLSLLANIPEDEEEKPEKEKKTSPKKKEKQKSESPKKKKSDKTKSKKKSKKSKSESKKDPAKVYEIYDGVSNLERQEIKVDMVHLLSQRERIRRKLGQLDIGKKKDAMKIAELNIELCNIDEDIKTLEEISGEQAPTVDHGSRIRGFVGGVKRKVKRAFTKAKKFFKRNSESITAISIMSAPVILGLGARLLLRLL